MPRRHPDELKLSGKNSCYATLQRRPEDIVRAYVDERLIKSYAPLLKALSARRVAYHVVKASELDAIADSQHHEGVILFVKRAEHGLDELLEKLGTGPACLFALDRVSNPNNLGAILRSAAHFGARAVLIEEGQVALTATAMRTAEGGGEWVDLVEVPSLIEALSDLKTAHVTSYATTARADRSLFTTALAARSLFILGSEGEGVSHRLLEAADFPLVIPGTGKVESLNVATVAALCAAEHYRSRLAQPKGEPWARSSKPKSSTAPRRRR